MSYSTMIGSFGVTLLLIAFFLNLFKFLSQDHKVYILLNVFGAGLSCYASILIKFLPFVLLEAIWCIVALAAFLKRILSKHLPKKT